MLLLCDQPFVTPVYLEKLVEIWHSTSHSIVASQYGSSYGPPAIFDKKHFAGLAALHGQQGAKKLMETYRSELVLVDFPDGEKDVDTPEDLDWLGLQGF
jgi:molybdenum cofactor cytidylyltransferase